MFHQGSLQIKITQASGKFEYPGKQRLNQDLKPEKSLRGGSMDQGWEELAVRRWCGSGWEELTERGWCGPGVGGLHWVVKPKPPFTETVG